MKYLWLNTKLNFKVEDNLIFILEAGLFVEMMVHTYINKSIINFSQSDSLKVCFLWGYHVWKPALASPNSKQSK